RDQSGEGSQHCRHAAFDIASPATIKLAVLDDGTEWIDGHIVHRDGILVSFPKDGVTGARAFKSRHDVVAPWRHRLPLGMYAAPGKKHFQVGSDPVLEVLVALRRFAHRVDARQADKVTKKTSDLVLHEPPHGRSRTI